MFDTVRRKKQIFKHEILCIQQCCHLANLAGTANALPRPIDSGRHTSTVGNLKIALSENIALLLHPHVDIPFSLVVTLIEFGRQIVSPWWQTSFENVTICTRINSKPFLIG